MKKICNFVSLFLFFISVSAYAVSEASKPIVKVGVLKWGTVNWELQTLLKNKLDEKNEYKLEVVGLANKNATAIALQGGEVDVIVSDYIWVNRQRADGANFTFVPHSLTVGGLIASPDSGIESVADLVGKKLGIAGGPVDKSWVILQAYAIEKLGINLRDQVDTVFAAPAVINEQIIEGKVDAVLNFWHYNARLKAAGMDEIISVKSVLKELDLNHKTPLLGWVFDKGWAEKNPDSITAFLDSSFQTKEILLNQLGIWEGLKKKMKADQDDVLFTTLRDAYRDGIVAEFTKDHALSASEVFSVMASIGGEKLVGSAKKLDPETFWEAYIAIGDSVEAKEEIEVIEVKTLVSYSSEQAARGKKYYEKYCAECHGREFMGGVNGGPVLRGVSFLEKYANGAPASWMFEFMFYMMPPDQAGRFSPKKYAAMMAYILKRNGFKSGAELPSDVDALEQLIMKKR